VAADAGRKGVGDVWRARSKGLGRVWCGWMPTRLTLYLP
jgi:hypothetical protein